MWSLKSWQGRFVEHPLPAGERLRAYAGWCNAVEGNTTFYATPTRETVRTWAEQTGPEFRMVLKLPRPVTHEHRLTGADDELRGFLDAIEPLGARVHALWVQLPASFGPSDVPRLAAFLRRLPSGYRCAVEVRHPAFFAGAATQLEDVLVAAGAEWVPFDTTAFFAAAPTSDAERDAWLKKPRLPRRTAALTSWPIVRYLGRDDRQQTVDGWQGWARQAAAWLREGRSPTFFIHTPDNADAPQLARDFHAAVAALVPSLRPLPQPLPVGPLTLF
ncbi:DUF72 domain-containing protein [Dactylosporangium sp. CA-052675]|uniref:DUF72 domain-containing protein n=1 Tax=Dactylosporangium sp. CA-052675 TaxID=3239927 RepID=UPI003D8F2EB7